MPTFEVTAQRGEDIWELLEAEKAKHADHVYRYPPEFYETGSATTAIQTYQVVATEESIEEVAVEATTCEAKKILGGVCGRDLPCRYHK